MRHPEHVLDIFLHPGDFYWGDSDTRIRTVLGSCVSICMWHPRLREGGMCHFMLPSRPFREGGPDGRYADEAMELFLREIKGNGTREKDYRVKLFGGGVMFQTLKHEDTASIGARNVDAAKELIDRNGFSVQSENVGGNFHRQIYFEVWSGNIWLKRKANLV